MRVSGWVCRSRNGRKSLFERGTCLGELVLSASQFGQGLTTCAYAGISFLSRYGWGKSAAPLPSGMEEPLALRK